MEDGLNYRSASVDDPDEYSFKRKRVTLACLPCKRRKAKCDKSKPCSTCLARNEAEKCLYDDGIQPRPSAQFVSLEEFLALQTRLERIEHHLRVQRPGSRSSHNSPRALETNRPTGHPLSPFNTEQSRSRDEIYHAQSNELENAAHTLETLAVGGAPDIPVRSEGSSNRGIGVNDLLQHNLTSEQRGALYPALGSNRAGSSIKSSTKEKRWPDILISSDSIGMKDKDRLWRRDMREILDIIPHDERAIGFLVDEFFVAARKAWHTVHQGLFRKELEQFVQLRKTIVLRMGLGIPADDDIGLGPGVYIDPAWLAQLCFMIGVSAYDLPDNPSASSSLHYISSMYNMENLVSSLLEVGERALACASWMTRPQMRVLTALAVKIPRVIDLEATQTGTISASYTLSISVAASLCKLLTYDQLGTDPSTMPPDDPMLPPGTNLLKRQLACRTFNFILFFDTFDKNRWELKGTSYHFPEGTYTTESPQNYPEDMPYDINTPPQPVTVYTENCWDIHKHRMCMHWRTILTRMHAKDPLTYKMVLQHDREMREHYQQLLGIPVPEGSSDRITRDQLDSGYSQRFLNLHRPFLIRSYRDPKYAYSQRTSVEFAFHIVQTHRALAERPEIKAWYLYRHHLSAITVLFVHALHTPNCIPEVRGELQLSLAMFQRSAKSGKGCIVMAAGHGDRIIATMLSMLDSPERSVKSIENVVRDVVSSALSSTSGYEARTAGSTNSSVDRIGSAPGTPGFPLQHLYVTDETERILQVLQTSLFPSAAEPPDMANLSKYEPLPQGDMNMMEVLDWQAAFENPIAWGSLSDWDTSMF